MSTYCIQDSSVKRCDEPKRWAKLERKTDTEAKGVWKYASQCLTCGNLGKCQTTPPPQVAVVTAEDVAQLQVEQARYQKENGGKVWSSIRKARKKREEKSSEGWRERYQSYLRSPEWKEIRAKVLARDVICRGCGLCVSTEVHHLTYDHVGNEFLFGPIGLCELCPRRYHSTGKAL